MKPHHIFLLAILILSGCISTGNLSSFGSRKYTKGYFGNEPSKVEARTKTVDAITTVPAKLETEKKSNLEQQYPTQAIKSSVKSIFSLRETTIRRKIVTIKSIVKSIDKIVQLDVKKSDNDTPTSDKPVDKKTAWGVIAHIAAVLVLLILAYAIFTIIISNGYLLLFLFVYSLFALIPAAIGIVSVIIALHIHDTHHGLMASLIMCIIPFVLILFLLLFP